MKPRSAARSMMKTPLVVVTLLLSLSAFAVDIEIAPLTATGPRVKRWGWDLKAFADRIGIQAVMFATAPSPADANRGLTALGDLMVAGDALGRGFILSRISTSRHEMPTVLLVLSGP